MLLGSVEMSLIVDTEEGLEVREQQQKTKSAEQGGGGGAADGSSGDRSATKAQLKTHW